MGGRILITNFWNKNKIHVFANALFLSLLPKVKKHGQIRDKDVFLATYFFHKDTAWSS